MNKYILKMKTLRGLGNEYVYVYAKSNFERYLNIHSLNYVRDITKDYQLTDRLEDLQQRIDKAIEYIDEYRFDLELPSRQEELLEILGGKE